ncbi:hypothetical protein QFC22_004286 [Naganishia vaughanmartiniae]|uniref:Uncharacterized protein n=1 Tax=Naganishia vaughanmartiniae TaxID=1424756 RepID=A0ACC2X200_9TREE|nr:hypothetical protein QFC22_004286 [Naganishia vaughanmartiniae]
MLPPPPLLTPSTERTNTPDMEIVQQEEAYQQGKMQGGNQQVVAIGEKATQQQERPVMVERQSSSRLSFQTAYDGDSEYDADGLGQDVGQGITIGPVKLGPVVAPGTTDFAGIAAIPSTTTTTTISGSGSAIPTRPTPTPKLITTPSKPIIGTGGIPITPSKSISSTTPTAAERLMREEGGAAAAGGRVRSGSVTIGAIHRSANTGAATSPSTRPDLNPASATTTTGAGGGLMARRSSIVEASGAGLKAWWNSFTGGVGAGVEEGGNEDGVGGGLKRQISRPRAKVLITLPPARFLVFRHHALSPYSQIAQPTTDRPTTRPINADVNPTSVFGQKLETSLIYAAVPISTAKHDPSPGAGSSGSIEKGTGMGEAVDAGGAGAIGSHLKETATEVEGTFRVSGSAKRMKDLQAVFDSPPKSLHRVRAGTADPSYTEDEQIAIYKDLILKMPKPNQYLLLYVLDMLSVFARRADVNLMTAGNLATIFQPGIIAHPDHEMLPSEHALGQKVLEFLINKQDHFLIGMELEPVRSRSTGVSSYVSPVSPTSPTKQPVSGSLGTNATSLAPPAGPGPVENATHSGRRRGSSFNRQPSSSAAAMAKNDSATGNVVGRATPSPVAVRRRPPSPQRADSSIMPASDSDDEAPPGGWYVKTGDPTSLLRTRKAAAAAAAAAGDTGVARSSSLGAGGLVTQLATRRHLKIPGASAMSASTSAASGAGDPLGHPQVTVIENTDIAALPSRSLFRRRTAPTRRNKEDEVMIRKRAERAVRDLGKMSAEAP